MKWNTWWLFVITGLALDLTPGPAVLYVLSSALRAGSLKSLAAAAGILSANTFYFFLSALGVGALILRSARFFFWIKWLGAAYLAYLGIRSITGSRSVLPRQEDTSVSTTARKLWTDGVLVQLSNPKAIVFFAAIVPQFLDSQRSIPLQMGILGVTSTACEFVVMLGYGMAAGRAAEWARQPQYAKWTNRVAGAILLCAGVAMTLLRQ